MAQKLNVPVSTLKSWEQGTAIPNYENWLKIKEIYTSNEIDIEKLEELYLQRKLKKNKTAPGLSGQRKVKRT